ITCSEEGKWAGYGDSLCALVDSRLTCSANAGHICLLACDPNGACNTGYSCLDPGAVPQHDNACLPTGSFPGSPCRSTSGNECDQSLTLGGHTGVNLVCAQGTCVAACPDNADSLCSDIDSSLTCSESAGNICVRA